MSMTSAVSVTSRDFRNRVLVASCRGGLQVNSSPWSSRRLDSLTAQIRGSDDYRFL